MKRREFLGAPVALAGLGLISTFSGIARAGESQSLQFGLLRLSGSLGDADDAELVGAGWQSAWPEVAPSLQRAQITVYGFMRSPTSTLGAIDVEAAHFDDRGSINQALVFASRTVGNSKPIVFSATAPDFGGFVISQPTKSMTKGGGGFTSVSIGDGRTGLLTPGLYALVAHSGKGVDPYAYTFSGRVDRPLRSRATRSTNLDYLAFGITAAV